MRRLRICDHKGSNVTAFYEHIPWSHEKSPADLFTGTVDSAWTGVGAVGKLVALALGPRGLVAIDTTKTKKVKKEGYDTSVPHVTVVEEGKCVFASSGVNHQHLFALFSGSEGTDFVIYAANGSTFSAVQKFTVKKSSFVAFDGNQ